MTYKRFETIKRSNMLDVEMNHSDHKAIMRDLAFVIDKYNSPGQSVDLADRLHRICERLYKNSMLLQSATDRLKTLEYLQEQGWVDEPVRKPAE